MKDPKGILLLDKSKGSTSFRLVSILRKLTGIQKIGHSGTLDPFASGLMILLIGREATKKSDLFLNFDKEYEATLKLGIATDTYDLEGKHIHFSSAQPNKEQIEQVIKTFQGKTLQVPPMFSAKKVHGKKLYELARSGIEIIRQPVTVEMKVNLISYKYPELTLHVECSKGTYIRSLADDLGKALGTYAHLTQLIRLRSGPYHLTQTIPQTLLSQAHFNIEEHLIECP
jgi:tRNA pseudouridine55 synthase